MVLANCMAQSFGAPVTVTARHGQEASSASNPGRSMPSDMIDGMKQFSSRSRSPPRQNLMVRAPDRALVVAVDIGAHVRSNSSFCELGLADLLGSPIASVPRAMVPDIGQVSTRRPSERHENFGEPHQKFAVARFISAP